MNQMTLSTISQSASSTAVFKYSFQVVNCSDSNDIEESVAVFFGEPTVQDWWIDWLSSWYELGFKLQSPPQLISIS